jgi:hypothetical protein
MDYIKRAGSGIENLLRYATLYAFARDPKQKKEFVEDMRKSMKTMSKKEVISFFMQLDRAALGITAIPRHVLMSVFGLEIATYNQWMEDVDYMKKEIKHIRKTLKRMGDTEAELKALDKFEKKISKLGKV